MTVAQHCSVLPPVVTNHNVVSSDGDDVLSNERSLKRQIRRLGSEVRALSASRTPKVRAEMVESLRGNTSDQPDGVTPPRTAKYKGVRERRTTLPCLGRQWNLRPKWVSRNVLKEPERRERQYALLHMTRRRLGPPKPGEPQWRPSPYCPVASMKQLKLYKYDGATVPLETFLAKF